MNVSLGQKWQKFVHEKLESGDYQNASEVVRDALRLLERQDLLRKISAPTSSDELDAALLKAIQSLNGGQGVEGTEAFAKIRRNLKRIRG